MTRTSQQSASIKGVPIPLILALCLVVGILSAFAGGYIEDPLDHISISLWVPTTLYTIGVVLMTLGGLYFTLRQAFRWVGPTIVEGMRSDSGCLQAFSWISLFLLIALVTVPVPLAFARLSHDLYLLFGGFTGAPNSLTYEATIGVWNVYAASWMLDSITVNISQIFNWMPTPITPIEGWSKWLLSLYCIALDVVVVAGAFNLGRAIWQAGFGRHDSD